MDKDTNVIIGGGLQGLATANYLLDRGEKVLLLEKEEGVALATSYANAGMLTPSQAMPWNSVTDVLQILSGIGRSDSPMLINLRYLPSLFFWGFRFLANSIPSRFLRNSRNSFLLASYSKDLTGEMRSLHNLNYDQSEKGTMKIFRSQKSLDQTINIAKNLSELGLELTIMDRDKLVKAEPALKKISEQLKGAIFYPLDEIGDAYKFCKELEKIIREKGGRIHVNTEIKNILVNKKAINGLVTDRVEIRAKNIIVAAGSWSYLLLKKLGLSLPVRPAKGYSLTLNTAGSNNSPKLAILDDSIHTAVTPFKNRIRIAGTAEFTGFNDFISQQRIDYLFNVLKKVYPDLYSEISPEEGSVWCGFRPMSPDGLPYIGETAIKGLYLNVGQGHLGWTSAMGSGALLADLIVGRKPIIDPSPYLANRTI